MPLWFRKERQLSSHRTISYSGEPDAVKVSRPVRRRGRAARPFPILAGGCQVYRVPLAILATGTGILAALSFCIGVILELDPQVFFACNSSSIDFSGVAFHTGHS